MAVLVAGSAAVSAQPDTLAVRHLTPADGLSDVTVGALAADAAGGVWVGGEGTVDRYDGVRVRPAPLGVEGLVRRLATTASGAVVAETAAGRWRWDPARQTGGPVPGTPPRLPDGPATARSEAYPGALWVGTRGDGLRVRNVASGQERAVALVAGGRPLRNVDVLALLEDRGSLWIGTTDGLLHADVTPPRFRAVRFDPDRPDGLRAEGVMSVHASRHTDGAVWVGTRYGGLHRLDWATGRAERWLADHPALKVPFAIHEAAGSAVWLGGLAPAAFRFEPGSALDAVPLARGAGGYVTDLVPRRGRPSELWATTSEAGVVRLDTERRRAEPLPGAPPWVWTVHETPDDPEALYAATHDDGLVRFDLASGAAARVEGAGCTIDDRVLSLASTPGSLWIGSFENRLFWLDLKTGGCRAYTPADGVPDARVGGLFADAAGRIWLSTMDGLARFDPSAEVFTRFAAADGMPAGALYFQARDQTPDGRILVGGANGFTVFDPLRIPIDTAGAPVRITRVRVDGEPVPLAALRGGLDLGFRRNDVALDVAALDLRQPEKVRYRVRLDPEAAWQPADAEIRFPALAPGRYTVQVSATNRDGYWSAPTELPVRIRPPYWQAPWFWALVALAAGGVGLAAHRLRVEQLLRVERTRRRIADDLHDDIGSKISSVALRLDAARHAPGLPDDARDRLGRLGETTRAVVADLRDTVWLVDAGHDDLRAVADRMEQFAAQTLEGRGGHVDRGVVPATPVGMEARRDLYLLFTEALHNAVRHAEADHVAVRIGTEAGAFRIAVEDDGRGFDPEANRAGRGMGTMRRRAEALGGALAIDSAPGAGTRVRFVLPIRPGRRLV